VVSMGMGNSRVIREEVGRELEEMYDRQERER